MKKLLLSFALMTVSIALSAQPQWKFHIAFEDALGAKDTIWLVYDTSATFYGVDTALGEGKANFDYNAFNVFIINNDHDSTKVSALPYTHFPYHGADIKAFNYEQPIIVRWDSSMFHAPYLPQSPEYINYAALDNDYFFYVNNDNAAHTFNMLWADSVVAPWYGWGGHMQFPMAVAVSYFPLGITDLDNETSQIQIFPNPSSESYHFETEEQISSIEVFNILGKTIIRQTFTDYKAVNNYILSLANQDDGMYIIKFMNPQNQVFYKKIIKRH
jgi:hypothetical protein